MLLCFAWYSDLDCWTFENCALQTELKFGL